ncbi:MAG TPA: glycosyltransferase family 39 protein, partial [Planctomycetaceae bacterium]|nr:glycosyltransferase family 39 protein [Planctomycetaceae bacterium]
MSVIGPAALRQPPVGRIGPLLAWFAAIVLAWFGFEGRFAEWSTDHALLTLGWLLIGMLAWRLVRERRPSIPDPVDTRNITRGDVIATVVIAAIAFGLSVATAWPQWSLPPAYHDEYSYLFQAETLLSGRFSWPSSSQHPELFDQMHVLNEGRMASRYYPGTGLWIAPWLAIGMPYLGHWIAGAASAAMVYWIARELADRLTGWIAGLAFAAAPGPALFSNLLLGHHPTLLALLFFTWAFLVAMRSQRLVLWLLAGASLAAAMLCRPATAAGFALPFGVWALIALGKGNARSRVTMAAGLGLPLLFGIGVMLLYNHSTTGEWWTSPYQLYTDLYTPRHVFGLNNVVRGEQHLGPKVLESYDTWAENLTPAKAWVNVLNRLLSTAFFTFDLPLMLITLIMALWLWRRMSAGWRVIACSIVTQHALHWPYWYAGIFGWHYVYETAPLWCLLLGYAGRCLQQTWTAEGRTWMPLWAAGLLVIAWLGMYVDAGEAWAARWQKGVGVIAYPRRQHALFQAAL